MQLTKKELLTLWKAISALETAYSVIGGKPNSFGYWECVDEACKILEKALTEGDE